MRSRLPDGLLLAVAIVWGASYFSAKGLTAIVGVTGALALRYGIAALGLAVVLILQRARAWVSRRLVALGVVLGSTQAAILWLETAGVAQTSATNAGVLISVSLLLTPLFETAMLKRRLPVGFYLAVVAAMTGIALLVSPEGFRMPSGGDLLVLAAALVRGFHVALTARLLKPGDSVLGLVALQMLIGSVIFLPIALPSLATSAQLLTMPVLGNAVFLGIGCSVFAFLVQAWAVQRTSAARASLLMGTEPLWAVCIGVGVAGDVLTPAQGLGAAFVLVGTFVGAELERRARMRRTLLVERSTAKPSDVEAESGCA